jgi:hypothetical protein
MLMCGDVPQGLAVIFSSSPGICKERKEDTILAAQSESRISAPLFALKTVYSLFLS